MNAGAVDAAAAIRPADIAPLASGQSGASEAAASAPVSFAQMLSDGIGQVNDRLVEADHMVRAFAVDDDIPVHQVTFALEQARMSLELMMQVRARLVEAYQQVIGMQI